MKTVNYKVIRDLAEIPKLDTHKPTFADIETDGLYTSTRLIQLLQDNIVYIIDLDYIDEAKAKEFISGLWTVWYNASYDLGTLNMTTAIIDDLYYLVRLAYPQLGKFSLDYVIEKMRFGNLYSGLDKKKLQKAGFKRGSNLSNEQLQYSAIDVYVLSKLWGNKNIQRAREIEAYKIDILNMRYAIKYQQNGLIPDRAAIKRELDAIEDIITQNSIKLNGLNPNSPKQVKLALDISSSAKDVLIKLIAEQNEKSDLAALVLEQRKLLKRRTMLKSYDYDKVLTRFNVNGAATSRFTATGGDIENGINAQQIPRDLQYLFQTPCVDYSIIHADFSTAELRAGCSIMGDQVMATELKNGVDLHSATAQMITGSRNITKADRQKGKAVNFGFLFGMSAPSFVEYAYTTYGVKFTQNEASIIKKKYTQKYKFVQRYHAYWWENYKDTNATTPLGHTSKPRLGTDAINYATQGCIAETTKLAIIYLVEANTKALDYIYNVVHDAIYLRVPAGEEAYWSTELVTAMLEAWKYMSTKPMLKVKGIPMGVEYEIYRYNKPKYTQEVFNIKDIKCKI